MRVCVSFGRYHFDMISTAPGRNPALCDLSVLRKVFHVPRTLLEKTQKESNHHKAGKIANKARAKHDHTPAEY